MTEKKASKDKDVEVEEQEVEGEAKEWPESVDVQQGIDFDLAAEAPEEPEPEEPEPEEPVARKK